jgi:hypothetical protein
MVELDIRHDVGRMAHILVGRCRSSLKYHLPVLENHAVVGSTRLIDKGHMHVGNLEVDKYLETWHKTVRTLFWHESALIFDNYLML